MLEKCKVIIYFYLCLLPFTRLLDANIPLSFGGISVINIFYVGLYSFFLLLLCLQMLMENRCRLFKSSLMNWSFIIFGGVVSAKIFMTSSPLTYFVEYQYYLVLILLGFILLNVDLSQRAVSKIFIITAAIIGLLSIYSFCTNQYFNTLTLEQMRAYRLFFYGRHRLSGIFSNPNVAAYYYLVLWMYGLCNKKEIIQWLHKYLYYGFMLLMLGCLFLTFSRSAYIILCMLVGIGMLLGKGSKIKYIFIGIGILIGLGVLSQFIYIFQQKDILENVRLTKWSVGLQFFAEHFLFGTPLEERLSLSLTSTSEWKYTFSDNEYIKIFARFGILGGLPFSLLFGGWLYKGAKELQREEGKAQSILFYGAIVFAVGSFFNNFLEFFPVTVYLLLIITQFREQREWSQGDEKSIVCDG